MRNKKLTAKEKYEAWKKSNFEYERFLKYFSEKQEAYLTTIKTSNNKNERQAAYKAWIGFNIGLAMGGDRDAATRVLNEFSYATQNDGYIPKVLYQHIGRAIAQILTGTEPMKALGLLPGKKGRPKSPTVKRDMELYGSVLQKVTEGKTHETALRETSEENPVSISTVKRAFKLFDKPFE